MRRNIEYIEYSMTLSCSPAVRGPHKSPAKRVLWGEDEQESERIFHRQAEMEWSGLCEDEGDRGCRRFERKRALGA